VRPLSTLALFALFAAPALAGEPDGPAASASVSADLPAEDPPSDGLWSWIDRMDGEVPTTEAVEAMEELQDEEVAEAAVMNELGALDIPQDVYRDPAGVLKSDPLFLDQVNPSEFDIPVVVNPSVEKWVRYFTGPGREHYARWLARATRYRPLMYAELDRAKLPHDLVYLSMIESGYNTHAYSHAAAAGLWQFMPTTGRLYDLRVDWWVDERRDPALATVAATRYLAELHKMFDEDWFLAWASYNGGPGRVRRATRSSGSTDFWTIAGGEWLHSETENYVPKIIAAAIIGKHPERYGFTGIDYAREFTYDEALVDGSVELELLAKAAGMSLDDFKWYNPALRRWATPPEGCKVRIVSGGGAQFSKNLAAIPVNKRLAYTRHRVAKGETLSGIAKHYGVTVEDISRASQLKDTNRIYVGMELVIPIPGGTVPPPAESTGAPPAARATTYKVAPGDTLSQIAARYGVSADQILAWNSLKSSTIYVGQVLTLQAGADSKAPAAATATTKHTVKPGETLSGIASKYHVSSADLQAWNAIKDASQIRVGQVLTVRQPATQWLDVTVKPGDSLGALATKYGCTVKELQQWNKLSGTVIHPGDKLRIQKR